MQAKIVITQINSKSNFIFASVSGFHFISFSNELQNTMRAEQWASMCTLYGVLKCRLQMHTYYGLILIPFYYSLVWFLICVRICNVAAMVHQNSTEHLKENGFFHMTNLCSTMCFFCQFGNQQMSTNKFVKIRTLSMHHRRTTLAKLYNN